MLLLLFQFILLGVVKCQHRMTWSLFLFNLLLGIIKPPHTEPEFGYGETTQQVFGVVYGPPEWHKEWEDCGLNQQSPINIKTSSLVNKNYPPLKITFDNPGGLVTGKLENNGHSPELTIDKSQGTASITGGPLGDATYTLDQFHVHFGCKNDRGSEHTLNKKQFAGELHMVFENSGRNAVIALWLKVSSRGNPTLAKFANLIPHIIPVGASKEVYKSDGIRLMELLSNNKKRGKWNNSNNHDNKMLILRDYYHYKGSFTTPPCTEGVKWLVLKPKLDTSKYQLRRFRQLRSCFGRFPGLMCDNYRPLQPLNGRKVYSIGNHK